MFGTPDFALFLSLSLTIFVFALAAKGPAASLPPMIAGLIAVFTVQGTGLLFADPVAHSLLLIAMGLSLPLIGFLLILSIIEMKV